MASIARRTFINLLECIRCFFLRGIDTSSWLPLSFYTDHRCDVFPTKRILEKQSKYWNGLQLQTETAKMVLSLTQTVQEMQQTATVALISASLTTQVASILITPPPTSKTAIDMKNDNAICASLPEITCSLIDSTPKYCYFIVNCSSSNIKKSFTKMLGKEKLIKQRVNTDPESDNDDKNQSFNDDALSSTIEFSSILLPRQRTCSESSDDDFICFVDDELDCKGSSGSSKNYGYFSNEYDSETDCSSDDTSDDEDEDEEYEEDEDCVILTEKKVRFDPNPTVHIMRTWNFAYRSARKSNWENEARDRVRFQNRIQRAATYLDPILSQEHRQIIYNARFAPATEQSRLQEPKQLDKPFTN